MAKRKSKAKPTGRVGGSRIRLQSAQSSDSTPALESAATASTTVPLQTTVFEADEAMVLDDTVSAPSLDIKPKQVQGKGKEQASVDINSWTVEDVAGWLAANEFDQDTCRKFEEQEITGSVLLNIQPNHYSRLGLSTVGKEVRFERALKKLLPDDTSVLSKREGSVPEDTGRVKRIHSEAHVVPPAALSYGGAEMSSTDTTLSAPIASSSANDPFVAAASPLREAAWGKVYPRTIVVSPVDGKAYQCYDFTESRHLDFISPSLNHVLIRPEYEDAYTYLKGSDQSAPVIITGQPGIGKTLFLVDLLIRRLEERQITAIQFYSDVFLLFDGDGVRSLPDTVIYGFRIPKGAWALSDSNVMSTQPSAAFRIAPVKTILASSPAQTRWKEWQKQQSVRIYLMNLWGKGELGALAALLGYDHADCLHLAATWGPSARQIVNLLANPQDETRYRSEVQWVVAKYLRNYNVIDLADASNLDFKEDGDRGLSSKVFFVRPDESRQQAVMEIPTGEIWKQLTTAITAQSNADIIKFFTLMSSHGQTRAAAGWMFETHLHAKLSMPGAEITLHNENRNTKIISSAARIAGTLSQLSIATPPFYWQPSEPNFPGIDSILCVGNDLYAFQATVSSRHKEAWQGLTKVSKYISKNSKTWHLVFVGLTLEAVNSVRLQHPSNRNWADVETYGCELIPSAAFQDRLEEAMAATPQCKADEQHDDEPMEM